MSSNKQNESNAISPLTEIFSNLGRSCTVPLIFALGERSYNTDINELRKSIDLGLGKKMSTSEISKCLSNLSKIGIVEGTAQTAESPKSEFSLTTVGQQFYKHLLQMQHLAERATSDYDLIDSVSAC